MDCLIKLKKTSCANDNLKRVAAGRIDANRKRWYTVTFCANYVQVPQYLYTEYLCCLYLVFFPIPDSSLCICNIMRRKITRAREGT